ncbi:MAG: RpiB/LacA/LacB family sugar-phosphate isomerase [Candidatus Micrarchaeota archaeon]|nr:RpiB/LacA/LacB family sugar-phosphate isomerase [Candidatus Micrarchaeota archaeon]
MKIYLISDNKDKEIALANAIAKANHSPIMSELSTDDYKEMVDEAIDNAKSGYDLMVMVSSDSVDACIEANKSGKLRALVCSTAEDAARARKAGVNLIIIDNSTTKTDSYNVIRGWMGGTAPAQKKEYVEKQQSSLSKITKIMPQKKEAEKEPEPEEEEDMPPPKKETGIIGKIKYTFGVE